MRLCQLIENTYLCVGNICNHSDHNLYNYSMENAVVQQIRKKITRSKFGEIFFVSSFPQYDVEYVTKLLAIFEKEGLITRIIRRNARN